MVPSLQDHNAEMACKPLWCYTFSSLHHLDQGDKDKDEGAGMGREGWYPTERRL